MMQSHRLARVLMGAALIPCSAARKVTVTLPPAIYDCKKLLEWTHTPVKLVTVFIPGCCEHPGGDKCCYLPKNDQVHGPGRNQHVFKTKCSCKVNPRTIKDVFKQLQLGSCTGHCSLHGTCS